MFIWKIKAIRVGMELVLKWDVRGYFSYSGVGVTPILILSKASFICLSLFLREEKPATFASFLTFIRRIVSFFFKLASNLAGLEHNNQSRGMRGSMGIDFLILLISFQVPIRLRV